FVSPSLHIGENFGLAAFRSLAAGNPAVLSSWGGHRDLGRLFKTSARCVPVRSSRWGPVVSPFELASAMKKALRGELRSGADRVIEKAKETAIRGLELAL